MTDFLLDTNVFLWFFWGKKRVESVRDLLSLEDSAVYISAVSFWEIAIKNRLGKLDAPLSDLKAFAALYRFKELPLTGKHADILRELPKIHNDPFDHMLVSQAISEPMRLITGDGELARYSSLVMVV